MKYIKTAFLISLFNFFMVASVVLALGKIELPSKKEVVGVTPSVTTVIPTEFPTITPTVKVQKKIVVSKDPFEAVFKGPAPTVAAQAPQQVTTNSPQPTTVVAAPTTDNRCIVTIDGQRYDVTVFRTIHSGGDIFQCGSEMSATFHNQHPISFLQTMAKYKI